MKKRILKSHGASLADGMFAAVQEENLYQMHAFALTVACAAEAGIDAGKEDDRIMADFRAQLMRPDLEALRLPVEPVHEARAIEKTIEADYRLIARFAEILDGVTPEVVFSAMVSLAARLGRGWTRDIELDDLLTGALERELRVRRHPEEYGMVDWVH